MDLRKLIESMDSIETKSATQYQTSSPAQTAIRFKRQFEENSIGAQLLKALGHAELMYEADETAAADPAVVNNVKKLAVKYQDTSLPSGANAIDPETGMIYYNDPSAKDTIPYNPKPMAFKFMDQPDQKKLANDLQSAGLQVINNDGVAYVDPNQFNTIINPQPAPTPAPTPVSGNEKLEPIAPYTGDATVSEVPPTPEPNPAPEPTPQGQDYAGERVRMNALLDKLEAAIKKPVPNPSVKAPGWEANKGQNTPGGAAVGNPSLAAQGAKNPRIQQAPAVPTQTATGATLTPAEAQSVLDNGLPNDVARYGGRDALKKIASSVQENTVSRDNKALDLIRQIGKK